MDELRTHYQVSFTAKQALSLFVGLLAALALAYFFGLMTGLAGSEPQTAVGVPSPAPEETPAAVAAVEDREAFPIPVTAIPGAAAPAPASTVQVFEDGEGGLRPVRRPGRLRPRRRAQPLPERSASR